MICTGIGSWPGTDVGEAQRRARDLCPDLPYLVEQPARGPGAGMIGRTAALLPGLAVELDRAGWRLTDRPGRDQARAQALWRESLDVLAETFDGYAGPLKVQLTGPWTLAAELFWRGDRVLAEPGARRDVTAALAEAAREHEEQVRRLVPGAQVLVQLDEPCLPMVLGGAFRTASGFARIPGVAEDEVLPALAAAATGRVVHCCAAEAPIPLLARRGARGLALDVGRLGAPAWEQVAAGVEDGVTLWLGVDAGWTVSAVVQSVVRPWRQLGLPARGLRDVVITPACGLAGAGSMTQAAAAHIRCREVASELEEVADA